MEKRLATVCPSRLELVVDIVVLVGFGGREEGGRGGRAIPKLTFSLSRTRVLLAMKSAFISPPGRPPTHNFRPGQ